MESHNSNWPLKVKSSSLGRRDLLCLFIYYLGFSRIRNLAFRFSRTPVARILAYHDIPDELATNFHAQIESLKKQANIISLDDFFAGRLSWRKINVAITFDDGYRGWVDNASPVLREFGLNATFFVSSGFVGLQEEAEKDFLRNNLASGGRTTGSISAEGMRKLAEEGFTVGGHTSKHMNLLNIGNGNELHSEIQRDKETLERITGVKVEYFAYPFGVHRNAHIDVVQIIEESGYRGAVTIVPGFNTASTDRFLLHRDLVDASLPLPLFRARVLGNQDGVRFVQKILQT